MDSSVNSCQQNCHARLPARMNIRSDGNEILSGRLACAIMHHPSYIDRLLQINSSLNACLFQKIFIM
jgi:hypothetical protein